MLRVFLRDSFAYSIPAFVSRGLSLLLIPIYSRVLTPANFGAMDMLLVFGALINLTIALEVSQGVARFHADQTTDASKVAYASAAFWFTVACYGVFLLGALLCSGQLALWIMGERGLEDAFRLGVLYISLNGVFYLIQNQFRWELRSRKYAESSLLVTFVTAGAVVWFTYALGWGLLGLLGGMSLGAAAGVVYGCWGLRRSLTLSFDVNRLREMLQYSAPLVPAGLAIWISGYVDRMMINHYLSLNEVGLYGIAYRLSSVVGLMIAGVQGALMPLVLKNYQQPDTPWQLARVFRVFIAGALLVFLALSIFARDILVLMTTPDFYQAATLVVYLVPAAMLSQMYIFAPGISIAKKTSIYLWVNLLGVLVNAALGWYLIPSVGMGGAAVATLVGNACIFASAIAMSQRLYPVPHDWIRLAAAAAVAVVLVLLLPILSTTDGIQRLLGGAAMVVMAGVLIALDIVRRDEVLRVYRMLRVRFVA
jgi:O-antigen/teichoic acid export membrane protein